MSPGNLPLHCASVISGEVNKNYSY